MEQLNLNVQIYKPFRFLNLLDYITVNVFIVLMCVCIFVANELI